MVDQERLYIGFLKKWAKETLPHGSHLGAVLSVEKNQMPSREFIVKIPIWLKLAEYETKNKPDYKKK
jgi:hypothetical protein